MGNSASLIHDLATVDPSARLGLGCVIKEGAVIGADAILGAGVVILERAIVGEGALLRSAVKVGVDAVIEAGAQLGTGVRIADRATIGKSARLGVGVVIQAHGDVGAASSLGTGVVVEAHARVLEGKVVSPGARIRIDAPALGENPAAEDESEPLLAEGAVRPVSALLIINVQNDYISGAMALKDAPAGQDGYEVVQVVNELAAAAPFDHVCLSLTWHPLEHVCLSLVTILLWGRVPMCHTAYLPIRCSCAAVFFR